MVRWVVSLNRVLICPSPLPAYPSAALLGIMERRKLHNVGEIGEKEKREERACSVRDFERFYLFKQFTKPMDVEQTECSSERAKA